MPALTSKKKTAGTGGKKPCARKKRNSKTSSGIDRIFWSHVKLLFLDLKSCEKNRKRRVRKRSNRGRRAAKGGRRWNGVFSHNVSHAIKMGVAGGKTIRTTKNSHVILPPQVKGGEGGGLGRHRGQDRVSRNQTSKKEKIAGELWGLKPGKVSLWFHLELRGCIIYVPRRV